jgi:hypothetical protein
MMAIKVIHFIQNFMLNSNLKSDIQKYIKIKRLKNKNGQSLTECQLGMSIDTDISTILDISGKTEKYRYIFF